MPRISLRQLLFLIACAAIAVVSVRYASVTWEVIIVGIAMAVFFAAVIVSLVDRGSRQAFAIGFVVVMLGYAFFKFRERPPTTADFGMPTTYLLVQLVWKTGNVMPIEYVLPIGHAWIALLLGYLGGLFSQFIYSRRMNEQRPAEKE